MPPLNRARHTALFACIAFCTVSGFLLGLVGDLVAGRTVTPTEACAALVLAPISIPLGVLGVDVPFGRALFVAGGLLFWPIYAFLVFRIFRSPRLWHWLALLAWAAQGFFQICHRLDVIMSA